MSRKGPAKKRTIEPDPIYKSTTVAQLINKVLKDGKKSVAETIVYTALEKVGKKSDQEALGVLKRALDNVRPTLEVRPARANTLSLRWLTNYARLRKEKSMSDRLANEILDASNGLGMAVKKREDTHKMAEANRAFAHYRW